MACGTPVASLPAGAAREVVDRRGGVLATDATPEALATALLQAVRLDRGRVRTSALRFDADRMVGAYEELLADLVRGAAGRVRDLV